jgi:hypothetical protein
MSITITICGQRDYRITWEQAKIWEVCWNFLEDVDSSGSYDFPVLISRINGDKIIFSEKALAFIGETLEGRISFFTKEDITEDDCKAFDKMILEEEYCSRLDLCDILIFVNFMGNDQIKNRICHIFSRWIRGKTVEEVKVFFEK